MPPGLTVIGVRHHSPACTRRVQAAIAAIRPGIVLIEGPCDFNPDIGELRLSHALPVAIFSFQADNAGSRASYTPFCAYSPEWAALQTAWGTGATPLFCDLPAWHPTFGDRVNRYADPHGLTDRARVATAAVARRLGAEGDDALWDALAEQTGDAALPATLDGYFDLLRPDGAPDPAEAARETFMGRYAAWAAAQGAPVVLVCGGWHARAIEHAAAAADGLRPADPVPDEGTRAGSYLVPYGYDRLDRFAGYAAGMPSPGYYDQVHAVGLAAAADWAMQRIARFLRAAGQVVSTADRVAWQTHAAALARVRGHHAVLRTDVLDAAIATLVKDALDRPAAWTRSGRLERQNDPLVTAMLRALCGDTEGRLAPGTRTPPLVADVTDRLQRLDLVPSSTARDVVIDWHDPADRPRAQALHQLLVLHMPGVTRLDGPPAADARRLVDRFGIVLHRDGLGALIEASRWGGTLPMAAAACLAEQARERPDDMAARAALLSAALFGGLLELGAGLLDGLRQGVASCRDVAALGQSGRQVVTLFRFGEVFGPAAHDALATLCEAVFERALWLLDGVAGDAAASACIPAVLVCRDLVRDADGLRLDRAAASALMARCMADDTRPPTLAGAALGYLLATGDAPGALGGAPGGAPGSTAGAVAGRVRRFGRPEQLGDFLSGLFALAREQLATADATIDAVAALVAGWDDVAFLHALPAMRLAFGWFPPREREAIARAILRRLGHGEAKAAGTALAWMRQHVAVPEQADALMAEMRLAERLAGTGLA